VGVRAILPLTFGGRKIQGRTTGEKGRTPASPEPIPGYGQYPATGIPWLGPQDRSGRQWSGFRRRARAQLKGTSCPRNPPVSFYYPSAADVDHRNQRKPYQDSGRLRQESQLPASGRLSPSSADSSEWLLKVANTTLPIMPAEKERPSAHSQQPNARPGWDRPPSAPRHTSSR
jgi:hypothetical protein